MVAFHSDQPVSEIWPQRRSSLVPFDQPIPAPKNDFITIAISGCSSSGKSTLALLLAEIFSATPPATPLPTIETSASLASLYLTSSNKENISPELRGTGSPVSEPLKAQDDSAIVIHEDAFFLDKSACPTSTFSSAPSDLAFMQETLSKYQSTENETDDQNNVSRKWRLGMYDCFRKEDTYPGSAPVWEVRGIDTDCWKAIDIPTLVSSIREIVSTGSTSWLQSRYEEQGAKLPGLIISPDERDAIRKKHGDLIEEMKEKFQAWIKDQAVSRAESRVGGLNIRALVEKEVGCEVQRPKFVIVEGFLLFPGPVLHVISEESNADKYAELKSEIVDAHTDLPAPKASPNEVPTVDEQEAAVEEYENLNAAARKTLMESFDIKLFLPTSKEQAKQRRFARPVYIDAPHGERLPGQMWKTEGYFNDVVWANYIQENQWLTDNGEGNTSSAAAQAEVHVRPGMDMGVEDTVRWAVDTILGNLESWVPSPRSDRVECECDGACEEYHRGQYGDDEYDDWSVSARKGSVKERKMHLLRARLVGMKARVVEFLHARSSKSSRSSEPQSTRVASPPARTLRKRKSMFFSSKGNNIRKVHRDEKVKDIGLKTVLGSTLQNHGFFSPKQEFYGKISDTKRRLLA